MLILHIASLNNNPYSGVSVAVPRMVMGQAQFTAAQIGFVNVCVAEPDKSLEKYSLSFDAKTGLAGLEKPFDRPDLVVFHEVYYPPFLKLSKECRKKGIPYIIVPHGCLTEGAQHIKHLKKLAGNLLLFNSFIRGAKALQCLSDSELQATHFDVKKFIGTNGVEMPEKTKLTTEEINIAPNRADRQTEAVSPARDSADEQQENDSHGLRFIYIGRLSIEIKGLDILIAAAAELREFLAQNDCTINIYGNDCDGSAARLRSMIIENGLENIVLLNGPVMGEAKEKKLLEADIFIQLSRFEGMPMGILEAMSYGLPCVLSEGTGLAEITRKYDAGWSLETENAAGAIVKAIQDCVYYDKEIYNAKCRNSIKLVSENFSLRAVAEKTVEEYGAVT